MQFYIIYNLAKLIAVDCLFTKTCRSVLADYQYHDEVYHIYVL